MTKFDLFDFYQNVKDMNILLQFKGAVSQEILIEIGEMINHHGKQYPLEIQKSFAVFVELSQNIMNYSAEKELVNGKEIGVGLLVFTEDDTSYNIYSGNQLLNENIEKLTSSIDTINQANTSILKEMYKEQARKPRNSLSKGAGLGLIFIARQSKSKIGYKINKINDEISFLELNVKIIKRGNNE
jgi:hypothetical protein